MTVAAAPRLGNVLVERGYLTLDNLQSALEYQQHSGRNRLLGEILVDLEYCTDEQILECLAAENGVPYASAHSQHARQASTSAPSWRGRSQLPHEKLSRIAVCAGSPPTATTLRSASSIAAAASAHGSSAP